VGMTACGARRKRRRRRGWLSVRNHAGSRGLPGAAGTAESRPSRPTPCWRWGRRGRRSRAKSIVVTLQRFLVYWSDMTEMRIYFCMNHSLCCKVLLSFIFRQAAGEYASRSFDARLSSVVAAAPPGFFRWRFFGRVKDGSIKTVPDVFFLGCDSYRFIELFAKRRSCLTRAALSCFSLWSRTLPLQNTAHTASVVMSEKKRDADRPVVPRGS
jgi:hypothetical protein